jgi:DNA-3-methyladenine glycosylase I
MSKPLTKRCSWAEPDPLMQAYHDQEWGRPEFDEKKLFEMLSLEGAQAGLSWLTILRKRPGYQKAFAGFDPQRVAGFDEKRIDQLVLNPEIVRHRGKISATINNARRILALWNSGQTLAEISWDLVDGTPLQINRGSMSELPSKTDLSLALSQRLKKLGFRFVGETTCYSYMQAAGIVNDHLVSCPQHEICQSLASSSAKSLRSAARNMNSSADTPLRN